MISKTVLTLIMIFVAISLYDWFTHDFISQNLINYIIGLNCTYLIVKAIELKKQSMKLKTLNKIRKLAAKQVGKSKAPILLVQMCIEYKMFEIMKSLRNKSIKKPSYENTLY